MMLVVLQLEVYHYKIQCKELDLKLIIKEIKHKPRHESGKDLKS